MANYDYLYDPEHKNKPDGSGWDETERGWSKSDYEKDIQTPDVKDKYVFEHNAVFKFESNMNVKFHGTVSESKSFPNRFLAVIKRFKSLRSNPNEYKKFQEKYSDLLDIVVKKSKKQDNELIVYGWSVRQGKTQGKFEVEMLGVDPVHTTMIGEEIAKEFGRVEVATDTPTEKTKAIIIDNKGNASVYHGLPPVDSNKTRFTFSTNVTIDIDNNNPKDFVDKVRKTVKNFLIGIRNNVRTKENELLFLRKVRESFEDAGVEFSKQQITISPVYGGYRDQRTHEVGTEISYDIHFKQIDPNIAVSISRALNSRFHQQSTLLTGYGKDKRAAFYVSNG